MARPSSTPLANQCFALRAVQLFALTVERAAQDRLAGSGEGEAGSRSTYCSIPLLLLQEVLATLAS